MQTTAALIGFYAVIYVLTVEKTKEDKIVLKLKLLNWKFTGLDLLFLIVILFSFITIALNALWIDSLSTHILLQSDRSDQGINLIILFLGTLFVMIIYTIGMIQSLR